MQVHLLDVGHDQYGDCILCEFGDTTVLIDGAHPGDENGSPGHESIPDQLGALLQQQPPYRVSLLIVTHAHSDHIGCLPKLVEDGILRADFALVADPKLGWGRPPEHRPKLLDAADRAGLLAAALREEVRTDFRSEIDFDRFLAGLIDLEPDYNQMIEHLVADGTQVVRFGRDDPAALQSAFSGIGLHIIGPSRTHLEQCADIIAQLAAELTREAQELLDRDPELTLLNAYRELTRRTGDGFELFARHSAAVNLQSLLIGFEAEGHKALFTGDMQFNNPQVASSYLKASVLQLRQAITAGAPYDLVKIAHHGSDDAFSDTILDELSTKTINFGICAGESSSDHPNPDVLQVLQSHTDRITWVRTDRNRLSTYTFTESGTDVSISAGVLNDSTPP